MMRTLQRSAAFMLLAALFAMPAARGQTPADDVVRCDAAMRAEIIDSVSAALIQTYIFLDVAEEMEQHVRRRLRDGAYDEVNTVPQFTQTLTQDLRSISRDRHLSVRYVPPEMMARMTSDADADELERERAEALARSNYNFKKIEIMPGNVGYLRFDSFVGASRSGPTAIAAMNFLANTDALIIDLRYNGGGSPSLIQLIYSYFYDEPTHLNSFYVRESDEWEQFWTQAHVEGPRMTEVDLYVLTSERTFSGAEEFSYNMKNLGRGTLVGDTTGGGAHPVNQRLFENLYVGMALPFGRAVNPISGTNWEGVGVIPDVPVLSEDALEHAYLLAARKLKENATDERRIASLDFVITGLEARLNPVSVSEAVLRSYVGTYAPRMLTFEDGQLWYQRRGNPRMRAIPMTETLFRFDEIDYFRIEVLLDESGQPLKLVGHYDNGVTDESPRTGGT
jgi:hypothetical protein